MSYVGCRPENESGHRADVKMQRFFLSFFLSSIQEEKHALQLEKRELTALRNTTREGKKCNKAKQKAAK